MMNKIFAFFCLTALNCISTHVHAVDSGEPQIQVTGEAVLMKPADQLSVTVSVVTQAKDAEQAINNNAEKMSQVIDSLEALNLTSDHYETGRYSITPVYSTPPKNPSPSWAPEILGYTVNNSLNIRTNQTNLAGSIIDQATRAGANSIDQLRFELKDPGIYRAEAITEATKVAMKDARTLADAANVKLDKVLSLSISGTQPMPVYKNAMMLQARGFHQTPIESGNIEVRAAVNVVYRIEN